MAGQKSRRKRKPETLVYLTVRMKLPYLSSAHDLMCLNSTRSPEGHLVAVSAIAFQTAWVIEIRDVQFFSSCSGDLTRIGSTSQSGSRSMIWRSIELKLSSRYSFPTLLIWVSNAFVAKELPL